MKGIEVCFPQKYIFFFLKEFQQVKPESQHRPGPFQMPHTYAWIFIYIVFLFVPTFVLLPLIALTVTCFSSEKPSGKTSLLFGQDQKQIFTRNTCDPQTISKKTQFVTGMVYSGKLHGKHPNIGAIIDHQNHRALLVKMKMMSSLSSAGQNVYISVLLLLFLF